MDDNDRKILSRTQKILKPNIEDVMPNYLEGDMLKNALEFIEYLRENKMKPVWAVTNGWKGAYKGKDIYYIRLPFHEGHFNRPNQPSGTSWERSWCVTPYLMNFAEYENLITDEINKKIITDNLYGCTPYCNGAGCSSNRPKREITVCGMEIIRNCSSILEKRFSLWIVNPDDTEIESIKKLLILEKNARMDAITKK